MKKKRIFAFERFFHQVLFLKNKNIEHVDNRKLNNSYGLELRTQNLKLNQRGWTLVELMLVSALIGIITPAITFLFMKASQGFAADEMHNHLKKLNEQTLLRIHLRLEANKHLFQNDPGGAGLQFLNKLQLAPASNPPPAVMANSQLPVSQGGTTITFSPNQGAQPSQFGNELLFAAFDGPSTIVKPFYPSPTTFTAPITVIGNASHPVSYSALNGGGPATVILDVYRFYYYYLTNSTHPIPNASCYGLVEWRSIQFVDYNEINDISDGTLLPLVVKWLSATGPASLPGGPISWAYDSSKILPYNAADAQPYAFLALNNGTGGFTGSSTPTIYQSDWTYLTQGSSGILSNGFGYGISPNSTGFGGAAPPVPLFATANAPYPGGFEVGIMGSSAGIQVLTRCLLVAKGAASRVAWNDDTLINNAKDVW